MKYQSTKSLSLILASTFLISINALAGNKDRIGQAGASELRINPWAESSGMGSAGSASVIGLEATNLNVAGLAFTRKTDMLFSRTNWLSGSQININAFGLAQRVGESSVIGISIMSMDFGDIEVTTENLPEGGQGVYSPQFMNLGLSFAKAFSNSIYGGLTVKAVTEQIANSNARGVCFDAGIRYVTGEQNNMKFGIALRNVGPKMKFSGDGFATKVFFLDNSSLITLEQRTEGFELPALLSIGVAYDYYLMATTDSATGEISSDHKITAAGTFLSNSFGKDQI
ncbi:MAG: DUF3308 domain-containing protein, partial [Flavobacteriales bacterium]